MGGWLAIVGILAVTWLVPPSSASASGEVDRLYLLGDTEDGSAWYGASAADPELADPEIGCAVGATGRMRRCPSPPTEVVFSFHPRVAFSGSVTWGFDAPLRFHVEATPGAVMTLGIQHGGFVAESDAAVETAPGVYDGFMTAGSPMTPDFATGIYVRIARGTPQTEFAIKGAGASYVTLPSPVAARSIPELVAADVHAARHESTIGERTFTFNDADYETWSFTGTLTPARDFAVPLRAPAAALLAWVDGFSDPYVHRVGGGGNADPSDTTQYPLLTLFGPGGQLDRRQRSIGEVATPAGAYRVNVARSDIRPELSQITDGLPYTLRVVAVYGPRTLGGFRFPLPQPRWDSGRAVVVARCPTGQEVVPQPAEAATLSARLSWDGLATATHGWTFNYSLPGVGFIPCGEHGTGARMRFTLAGPRVWMLGPTPDRYSTFVALQDVRFEMDVRYAYTI